MAKLRFCCGFCAWTSTDFASLVRHWQGHQPPPRQTRRTILRTILRTNLGANLGAEYLAGGGRSMAPIPADPSIGGANA